MNEQLTEYISKYPEEVTALFMRLRQLILEGSPAVPDERMWAKLPSWYVGEAFVRLIPFKDHVNVEAAAMLPHKDELTGFKLTPKGMLQLRPADTLPEELLRQIFSETLTQ